VADNTPGFTAEEVQRRIDGVPFSDWLGLRAESIDNDRIVLRMEKCHPHLGNPEVGAVHGGVLASMMDIACSYVLIVPTRRSCVTVDLRIDYHRPAFGNSFVVEAWPVNRGRTITVAEGAIRDEERRLITSGRALLMQR